MAADRFPTALVRDLQGLVRLLYRAEQDVDMPESYGRLGRLEEAGRAFSEALKLAENGKAGVARGWAQKGVVILRESVADQPELAELVRVTTMPLRPPPPPRDDD